MTLLVRRAAVVAGAGQASGGGLVDLGEVEGEVRGDVGVGCVDAAIEDGDADACAEVVSPRGRARGRRWMPAPYPPDWTTAQLLAG